MVCPSSAQLAYEMECVRYAVAVSDEALEQVLPHAAVPTCFVVVDCEPLVAVEIVEVESPAGFAESVQEVALLEPHVISYDVAVSVEETDCEIVALGPTERIAACVPVPTALVAVHP